MAFSDMNDVEQELGEEKPPQRSTNRTFWLIVGVLGGITVLALLCIGGLALFKVLPNQRTSQNAEQTSIAQSVNATNAAQALAIAASQTALAKQATATKPPTAVPTNTKVPTKTPVIIVGPSKTPTLDVAIATQNALLTQIAKTAAAQVTGTPAKPTSTGLPATGIAEDLGTPGLLTAAFVLVVIIFLVRRLRTAS
jgi:hypothetical protein